MKATATTTTKAPWEVRHLEAIYIEDGGPPEIFPGAVRVELCDPDWPGEEDLGRVFECPGDRCAVQWDGGRLYVTGPGNVPLGVMTPARR